MAESMIPHVSQPIADKNGTVTMPWQRFLDALNEALIPGEATSEDVSAAVRAIATALGSPDGTPENIPAFNFLPKTTLVQEGVGIDIDGSLALGAATIGLEPLADSGVGAALKKYTRDAYGRLSGTQNATTDDLTEGATNLYFTNERAQDAVGTALTDSASIDFTYDDTANTITGVVKPTTVAAGSYGNATNVATFTVGADGRLTLAGQTAITFPADAVSSVFGRTGAVVAVANDYTFAQIGSKPTTLVGYGITDGQPLDAQLTDLAALTYASNALKVVRVNAGETGWELTTVVGLTDGDKGDVTVSASGATWMLDAGVVTLAKQANVATGTVFYRKTAGVGAPEVQTLATLGTDLALVADTITDGVTNVAPSQNAVFDALALKTTNASAAITGGTINGATIGATTPAACTFTTLTAGSPGIGRYFNVGATGAQLIRIDNNARVTPLIFANYGITALNQGFQIDFAMGAGSAFGANAAELRVVSTDTWAAAANRSSELTLFLNQAGAFGLALTVTRAAMKPGADNTISCGTSTLRWSETYSTNLRPGVGTVIWTSGSGTPEAVVTAPIGSLFTRTDGGASTTLYVKESGAGNTGWRAV